MNKGRKVIEQCWTELVARKDHKFFKDKHIFLLQTCLFYRKALSLPSTLGPHVEEPTDSNVNQQVHYIVVKTVVSSFHLTIFKVKNENPAPLTQDSNNTSLMILFSSEQISLYLIVLLLNRFLNLSLLQKWMLLFPSLLSLLSLFLFFPKKATQYCTA